MAIFGSPCADMKRTSVAPTDDSIMESTVPSVLMHSV